MVDNVGEGSGHWLELPDGELVPISGLHVVGRSQKSDIVINDSVVSRQHAEVFVQQGEVYIKDLGSSNGTVVNGSRIAANEPVLLRNGDEVRMGESTLRFHGSSEGGVTAPAPRKPESATMMWETAKVFCLVRSDGRRFPVTHDMSVGRGSENDVVLEDTSSSRRHARLEVEKGVISISDLGSSNGTWVNGRRIPGPVVLKHGDRVTLGDSVFTFAEEGKPLPDEKVAGKKGVGLGMLVGGGMVALVAGGVLLVVVIVAVLMLANKPQPEYPLADFTPVATSASSTEGRDRALHAVVLIAVPVDGTNDEYSTGSGSILTEEGHVLTNFHVVGDPDTGEFYNSYHAAYVGLNWEHPDEEPDSFYIGEVVEVDKVLDLAVLQIKGTEDGDPLPPDLKFQTLPVGNSDSVSIGDELTIIGFPGLGGSTVTLTRGTVSGFLEEGGVKRAWMKTDAEINPGNSGGMAINANGELIGVPTITVSGIEVTGKIGGVRPINLAYPVIKTAIE